MREEAFEIRDIRKKEQFVVDDTYLNGYAKVCGIYATGVYVALCRHADSSNQTCFPSISLIARKLNISQRQVIRALQILEDYNIIRKEKTDGRSNKYWLVDKKHWKPAGDCQAPVTMGHRCHTVTSDHQSPTSDCQAPEPVTGSHTKDSHIRIHNKGKYIPLPEPEDIPYEEIISCLNEKAGSSCNHARPKTRQLIGTLWKEGFRLKEFKKVIDNMTASWGNNPKMQNYLRPETLFSNKFKSYLNWKTGGNNGHRDNEANKRGKPGVAEAQSGEPETPGKYAGIGEVLAYD